MIAIYRIFNNGKRSKNPLAVYNVKTKDEANYKFVQEGIPFRYSENVSFEFVNISEQPTVELTK